MDEMLVESRRCGLSLRGEIQILAIFQSSPQPKNTQNRIRLFQVQFGCDAQIYYKPSIISSLNDSCFSSTSCLTHIKMLQIAATDGCCGSSKIMFSSTFLSKKREKLSLTDSLEPVACNKLDFTECNTGGWRD